MTAAVELSDDLAMRALAHFPILPSQVRPLRRSDNLTWQVVDQQGRLYLLRIHRSITDALAGARQRPDMIRSELDWLSALGETGLDVQRPVHARDGSWVAKVSVEGRSAPCTLLSWIDGEPYEPGDLVPSPQIKSYSRLAALLHAHAAAWDRPPGFIRPSYDCAHFEELFKSLHAGLETHLIDAEDWMVLRRAMDRLLQDILVFQEISGQWGLIHADLHSGNLLLRGNQVLAIDFSLCGFGSFLYDLGIALVAGVPAAQRGEFLQSYRRYRPFSDDLLPALDAYGLAGVLSYCAFQMANPAQWEWLTGRIPRLAAGECRRYLSGQPIYWEA